MNVFRKCMYEEIISDLRICTGAPTAAASAFRTKANDLFFGSFPKLSKALVRLLPNGEWRHRGWVEFYPPCYDGCDTD